MGKKSLAGLTLLGACFAGAVPAQELTLHEGCVVNILNRTVAVGPDGRFTLQNVPSFMGRIRARATCSQDGETVSGQTDYFVVVENDTVEVGGFRVIVEDPVPTSLTIQPQSPILVIGTDTTVPLSVTANFKDGSAKDITAVASGTNYQPANPAIVTVNDEGVLQGHAVGSTLLTVRNNGVIAVATANVVGVEDSDLDGIPDDVELFNDLDPDDPSDAYEDHDRDGLTALDEFLAGTDIREADTDGDGLQDGEELKAGEDGYITNPLLADTDNDGLPDFAEVFAGTDPTDPTDFNIAALLADLTLTPANPVIVYNSVFTEASLQMEVTGLLTTGSEVDLTSTDRGTTYQSSDLTVFSFGGRDGELFAGQEGSATLTVANSGIEKQATVVVRQFDPTALSFVDIPGYANNVDVEGDYAYVAAGSRGLQVVSVADPA
ncbi:MAG: hypothetical protein R3310_11595, partial [Candidatus Competibacteraceae bacterium]|nr:hypothetical protein [Candidatus Competibacteraceae bacterium]